MENPEETRRTQHFERAYTTLLLLLVALLLLVSFVYTTHLWPLKVFITLVLICIGALFCRKYLQRRELLPG